jgi:hypothetical protein
VTAQGEDILAYLDSAISSREAVARAAQAEGDTRDGRWYDDQDEEVIDDSAWRIAYTVSPAFRTHIALNDPASVLRRCAADRKLIELHRPQQTGAGFPDIQECRTCSADSLGDGYQYLVPAPCPSLLALAEGYGWTEGER